MSYHGAAIGAVLGIWVYSIKKKVSLWTLLDLLGWASTLGIGLGRVANFINGELYGRVTALPWGMVFPNAGVLPRHPSQLYEALGEGLLLWGILTLAHRYLKLRDGQLFGLYMMGYGAIRFGIEFAREPDVQVGYLFGAITAGQALCLLMVILGSWVYRKRG
jgi:phosphatidylglycerol:prolipoprotein diacylglycerol transferase